MAEHLVLAQLAAEAAVQAEASAQMHLEALNRTITVVNHLALEPDVGDLDAGAGVRAAVDVDRDRDVELRIDVLEPLLQVGHQALCAHPRLGEAQLAVLDAGAGHQVAPPMRRPRRQAERLQRADHAVELVVGHVEDDQFLVRGEPHSVRAGLLGDVGDGRQDRAGDASGDRGDTHGVAAVLQPLHPDVVDRVSRRLEGRTVDQRALEVLGLDNLPEFLDAPVLDQELQPRLGPQAPVAVVAERRGDGLPDVGHLVQRHPRAEPLAQHRVGGQATADPHVQPGAVLGVVDADERDVVDLVDDVLQAGDRGLVLARKVGVLGLADVAPHDLVDGGRGVEHFVQRLARERRAEHHARAVAARLGGLQADGLQPPPDLRDVLHLDPVHLQVLAVGDVGGVAGELGGQLAERAQLLDSQCAAIAAHPHHEVLRLDRFDVLITGPGAVVALLTLRVEAPPAESAAQVVLVDAVESTQRVDVLDAGPHVEGGVVLLVLFVGVQRLAVAERPLAFTAMLGGTGPSLGHCGVAPCQSRHSERANHRGCPAAQIRMPAGSSGGRVYGIKADSNSYKRA